MKNIFCRRCIKIMAAEHTYKLLLAESKKSPATANTRPRADDPGAAEGSVPDKRPKQPKRAAKAKNKPAWGMVAVEIGTI